jgi:hypothetical protein
MSAWTLEEQLAFDIAFALKKGGDPRLSYGAHGGGSLRNRASDLRTPQAVQVGVLKAFGTDAMTGVVASETNWRRNNRGKKKLHREWRRG